MNPLRLITSAILATLAACSAVPPSAPLAPLTPLAKENILAVTESNQLIGFNAARPETLRFKQPLAGLRPGEAVLGIDFRVARGELFALGSSGQLYRIDRATAEAKPVGPPHAVSLVGNEFGMDFNPAVDRVRVVSDSGQNLRLHPDTGAMVDADPMLDGLQIDSPLAYAAGDTNAGRAAAVVAAGYTYNKQDEKLTTNFAIDARQGLLATMGTREGVQPAESPNTGRLHTVGSLGLPAFDRAAFDIGDLANAAYAALTAAGAAQSSWVGIDLATGRATLIGTIGGGEPIRAIAIEP